MNATNDKVRCASCGHELPAGQMTIRAGRVVCDDCARHLDQRR